MSEKIEYVLDSAAVMALLSLEPSGQPPLRPTAHGVAFLP